MSKSNNSKEELRELAIEIIYGYSMVWKQGEYPNQELSEEAADQILKLLTTHTNKVLDSITTKVNRTINSAIEEAIEAVGGDEMFSLTDQKSPTSTGERKYTRNMFRKELRQKLEQLKK